MRIRRIGPAVGAIVLVATAALTPHAQAGSLPSCDPVDSMVSVYVLEDQPLRAGVRATVQVDNDGEAAVRELSVSVDGVEIRFVPELLYSTTARFVPTAPRARIRATWIEDIEQADGSTLTCAAAFTESLEVIEIPRVRGLWSFRFLPANPTSEPMQATWRLSQACTNGACSFTARPRRGQGRFWFKRANGRYTWQRTVRTDATCQIIFIPTGEIIDTYHYRGDWKVQVRIRSSTRNDAGRLDAARMSGSASLYLYVPSGTWSELCDDITLRWFVRAGRALPAGRATSPRSGRISPDATFSSTRPFHTIVRVHIGR